MSISGSFYNPLDATREEIRILEIINPVQAPCEPVLPLDTVNCRIKVTSLLERPIVCALSYVWGDASDKETILINGNPFPVTKNLAAALKYARGHWQNQFPDRDTAAFHIWADAVCINQKDNDEKAQQIGLMSKIYGRAETVISWLGSDFAFVGDAFCICETLSREKEQALAHTDHKVNEFQQLGFKWMEKYPRLSIFNVPKAETKHSPSSKTNSLWFSLADLCRIPYWSRVWIFQEVCLAGNALLVHGSSAVRFQQVDDAVQFLSWISSSQEATWHDDLKGKQHDLALIAGFYQVVSEAFEIFGDFHATRHILQQQRVSDLSYLSSTERMEWLFSRIVRTGSRLQCGDVRDRVFGLLGVFDVGTTPDYGKSAHAVFIDFIELWVALTGRVEVLRQSGGVVRSSTSELPSWIPPFDPLERNSEAPWYFSGNADEGIFNDDATCPSIVESALHVSALVGPRIKFRVDVTYGPGDSVLEVFRGLSFLLLEEYPDGLSKVHPFLALLQVILRTSLTDLRLQTLAFGMLRTVEIGNPERCSPRYADVFKALPGLKGGFKESYAGVHRDHFSIARKDSDGPEDDARRRAAADRMMEWVIEQQVKLLTEVKHVLLHHNLTVTDDHFLCLAPRRVTEKGDFRVCIIKGCQTPVILEEGKGGFIHAGACYVAGLMEGKACEWVESGTAQPEEIIIR